MGRGCPKANLAVFHDHTPTKGTFQDLHFKVGVFEAKYSVSFQHRDYYRPNSNENA